MTDRRIDPATDRTFARDVARQLEVRRRRRRLLTLLLLLGALIAAAMYLRCGGWGLGGRGEGSGAGSGAGSGPGSVVEPAVDAGPVRCAVRVTSEGMTVGGTKATLDEVVTACKATTGAEVLITGDARQGDWDDLRTAFDAAGIVYLTREPRGVAPIDAGI
ncbi:MAG: hypothetical protein M3680_05590 [Myxococcota bacterium]|nr:hypothetical protein [Myxococcota bacterium]